MVYCQNCGHELPDRSNFCASCGASLKTPQIQKSFYEKNCPKCGSARAEKGGLGILVGKTAFSFAILKKARFRANWVGDKIFAFYCKNCGYIEFFIEKLAR